MDGLIFLLSSIGGFLFFAGVFTFAFFRGLALLQFYQQEEYDSDRFLRWVWQRRAFDKRATLIVLVGFLIYYFLGGLHPGLFGLGFYALGLAGLGVGILASRRTLKEAKKPLVKTPRAQRIHFVYLLLVGLYFAFFLTMFQPGNFQAMTWSFLFFFQFPPFFLAAGNFVLKPLEDYFNNRFLKQAQEKMAGLNPTIVAITGSYGKTSIKHILAHILAATAPTLATPGSVNTPLGIVRIIRENLEKKHKYFVVEMGAYGPGSIKRLCGITPPDMGIISAVGYAHFERFKSLDQVFSTKFELARNLQRRGKKVIVNTEAIDPDLLKKHLEKYPAVILCGAGGNFVLKTSKQTATGLEITLGVVWKNKKQDLKLAVPLFGTHQGANILLAVAAALELGIAPETIRAALKTMPQISHRLEVTTKKGGLTVIDDAYNSNPSGFISALDLLETLKKPKGRAILLTPGMVELGAEHNPQHKSLGARAAEIVDVALVVGPDRMAPFIDAFQETRGKKGTLYTFKTQANAEQWLVKNTAPEDVVLIENNLPDLYEADIVF